MRSSLLENKRAKFKVDRLSPFRTGARQVFTTQKLFPRKCNIKFPLNTFSDQITISQIPFKIFDVKQIDARAKK